MELFIFVITLLIPVIVLMIVVWLCRYILGSNDMAIVLIGSILWYHCVREKDDD